MALFDFLKNKSSKESLDKGLEKTRTGFLENISKAIFGKSTVDDEVLDQLEELLIASDVGVATTLKIIENIQKRVAAEKYVNTAELQNLLKQEVSGLITTNIANENEQAKPYVIMVVGVNGVGKTTTIGKLASLFQKQGLKVVLGAGDTFRAAAVDQLKTWGQRANVPVIEHGMNTDPAAVAYDAVKKGVETDADVVIIDTAGRLHNKVNLMNELAKIKRVMQKVLPNAPHEVLLVLDGSTGQNALQQAKEFSKVIDVTALAVTKLDGTAKGGVIIGISYELNIPIKYVGVGERIEDLQLFDCESFVDSLFKK